LINAQITHSSHPRQYVQYGNSYHNNYWELPVNNKNYFLVKNNSAYA